jgi:Bacterial dnaA protein helix-turn-helix
MLPKKSSPSHLPSPPGTRAIPLSARRQTEGSVLCFLGSSRLAGPSQKADLGRRELAPGPPSGAPAGSEGANDMDTTSAAANDTRTPALAPYERYAAIFSLAHAETHSIAAALELVDTFRAQEAPSALPDADLPSRVLKISAALFSVPIERLHQRLRHRDVTSARYVAAWLLSRRHWASTKIGAHLGLDHSTVLRGIRRVEATDHLRTLACKAELLLGVC